MIRGRDELEGRAGGASNEAAQLELESQVLALEDELRACEADLDAAQDDKAALGESTFNPLHTLMSVFPG